jgi:hypothetical protein
MKPGTSKDTSWTWLQMAQGPKHEAGKLQGPRQKMLKLARQGALSKPWRRRCQGLTCIREQVSNWPRSIREWDGLVLGPVRTPFDLGARLFIASASTDRHIHPFIREPPTRRRSTGRKTTAAASSTFHVCLIFMNGPPWWSHGGVLEPMPSFHQGNYTFYIWW